MTIYPGIISAMVTVTHRNVEHDTLAAFLRAHRARVAAENAGPRRRTPGLRREEVAQRAGISTTWYTWMEQGRDVSVSPAALARLAQALELSAAERAYLFEIAGKRDPHAPTTPTDGAPETVIDAVKAIRDPAYVLDRYWNAVAWNRAAENLFEGWLRAPAENPARNLLRYIFTTPAAQRLIGDWEDRARRVLAEFRVDYGRALEDRAMMQLVEDLQRTSRIFTATWAEQLVLSREGGERTFHTATEGTLTYRQATFNFTPRPEFKLVILTRLKA